ncbi:hypothetical protein, partial [Nocardia abscessus]|uniref:hypothetical protein n=1 Tax=Nocardia abscessus TaxID=120957 RepID=UPI0024541EA3
GAAGATPPGAPCGGAGGVSGPAPASLRCASFDLRIRACGSDREAAGSSIVSMRFDATRRSR